jgi:hypothetical protein
MGRASRDQNGIMKIIARAALLLLAAIVLGACANPPKKQSASPKKLKLETIDHGPMRPKTYLYREVN